MILIPEIPFDLAKVAERILERDRWGARFSIVVVAEGAFPKGGKLVAARGGAAAGTSERLGGMGAQVSRAALETHDRQGDALGRARPPAARRRADELRPRAGDALRRQGRRARFAAGSSATMVAFAPPDIVARPLEEVVGKTQDRAARTSTCCMTAKALGVTFGD